MSLQIITPHVFVDMSLSNLNFPGKTLNPLSTVVWPWGTIKILNTFRNMINLLYLGKTAKWRYRRDQFLCQIWQRNPCSLSLSLRENLKAQVLLHQLPYLVAVYKRQPFWNFLKDQLARSWGSYHEVWRQTFQTPCTQSHRSGLFSTAWLQRLAKNSNASFLNAKTCRPVTFLKSIRLFNLYFIPRPKLTLLTSFQFVDQLHLALTVNWLFYHSQAHLSW